MSKNPLFSLKTIIWVVVGIFCLFSLSLWASLVSGGFKFLNWYDQKLNSKVESKVAISSKNCQDGWKIDLTEEKGQDGFPMKPYTYRYLSFSKGTKSLELTYTNADISKYNNKGSSEENLFPLIAGVQKKLQYTVLDPNLQLPQTNYDNTTYNLDKFPFDGKQDFKTIYLSPDKFSQQEYKIAAQCYQENYAYFQGLNQEKEMTDTAAQIMVWAKPKDVLIQTERSEVTKYGIWPLATLDCSANTFVGISANGIATLTQTEIQNVKGQDYLNSAGSEYLGYFDPNNQFVNKNPSLDIQNCRDKNGKNLEQMFK